MLTGAGDCILEKPCVPADGIAGKDTQKAAADNRMPPVIPLKQNIEMGGKDSSSIGRSNCISCGKDSQLSNSKTQTNTV